MHINITFILIWALILHHWIQYSRFVLNLLRVRSGLWRRVSTSNNYISDWLFVKKTSIFFCFWTDIQQIAKALHLLVMRRDVWISGADNIWIVNVCNACLGWVAQVIWLLFPDWTTKATVWTVITTAEYYIFALHCVGYHIPLYALLIWIWTINLTPFIYITERSHTVVWLLSAKVINFPLCWCCWSEGKETKTAAPACSHLSSSQATAAGFSVFKSTPDLTAWALKCENSEAWGCWAPLLYISHRNYNLRLRACTNNTVGQNLAIAIKPNEIPTGSNST